MYEHFSTDSDTVRLANQQQLHKQFVPVDKMVSQFQYSVPQFGQQMDSGFMNQDHQASDMFKYRNCFENEHQTLETLDFMQLKTAQCSTETRKYNTYRELQTNASSLAPADYDLYQPTNFDLNHCQIQQERLSLEVMQIPNTLVQPHQLNGGFGPIPQMTFQQYQDQIKSMQMDMNLHKVQSTPLVNSQDMCAVQKLQTTNYNQDQNIEPVSNEDNSLLEANLEQPISTEVVVENLDQSEIQHDLQQNISVFDLKQDKNEYSQVSSIQPISPDEIQNADVSKADDACPLKKELKKEFEKTAIQQVKKAIVEKEFNSYKRAYKSKKTGDTKKRGLAFKPAVKQSVRRTVIKANKETKKQFDFFFARTCFRYMSEYYKYLFAVFVDQYLKEQNIQALPSLQTITQNEVEYVLTKFLDSMFDNISQEINDKEMTTKLVISLSAILFSHRYDKKDQFIMEYEAKGTKINFNIIRDVMYKYSKKAQRELMSRPEDAFFLMNFASTKEGKEFIEQKEKGCAAQEDQERNKRIFLEIENLTEQAKQTLRETTQQINLSGGFQSQTIGKFLLDCIEKQ